MITESLVWLIIALPVISVLVTGLFVRVFLGSGSKYTGYVSVAAIIGSFVLSFMALLHVMPITCLVIVINVIGGPLEV